jgi:hypothetical protein
VDADTILEAEAYILPVERSAALHTNFVVQRRSPTRSRSSKTFPAKLHCLPT